MYERLRELELAGVGKKRLGGDLGTWQGGDEGGGARLISEAFSDRSKWTQVI